MVDQIPPLGNIPQSPGFTPQSIFAPVNTEAEIGKGSLVKFHYLFHKPGHDPTPLVLVTDPDYRIRGSAMRYVRGVNIHYLTFPTIKWMLDQRFADNPGFSYQHFKGNDYITSAFRQYKKQGIRQVSKVDTAFIVNLLASLRPSTISPNELEAMRQNIRQQISQQLQVPADISQEQPYRTT